MQQEQIQTRPNPVRRDEPPGHPARSAVSLVLEGIGLVGTIGAVGTGAITGFLSIGTTLLLPGVGFVAGPIVFGFTGAGIGALVGGVIGALVGAARAASRPVA